MTPAKEFEGELWIKAADFHWQKKEWVGLTDEEFFNAADDFGSFQYGDAQGHKRIEYARAIEAKLKQKNT